MALKKFIKKKMKKMDYFDVKLSQLGTAALFLMIAKLWPPLLSLEWYWYLIIAIVLLLKPIHHVLMFFKR
jgi:hypothetical protein